MGFLAARFYLVLCFYPALVDPLGSAAINSVRAALWNKYEPDLRELKHRLVAVTSEPVETQVARMDALEAAYMSLSDPTLSLAQFLPLESTQGPSAPVYQAATLIVRRRVIVKSFLPAGTMDAQLATDWVRSNR